VRLRAALQQAKAGGTHCRLGQRVHRHRSRAPSFMGRGRLMDRS
jgi:hypothetical protein